MWRFPNKPVNTPNPRVRPQVRDTPILAPGGRHGATVLVWRPESRGSRAFVRDDDGEATAPELRLN